MEKFIVASIDEPFLERTPVIVSASSSQEAIERYLVEMYAFEASFRQWVLDKDPMFSFTGQVISFNGLPSRRSVTLNELRLPMARFFEEAPTLGAAFIQYLESGDTSVITEDIYRYIALGQGSGFAAVRMGEIRELEG